MISLSCTKLFCTIFNGFLQTLMEYIFSVKGSIFGQMFGTALRPSVCSAQAAEHTDLLQLSVKEFRGLLDSQVRIRDISHSL